ncbi:hypothetical protein L596_011955 [Steinernema carpocapsae]|uniref:Uncharacterized protein n=1 Tax=Steinernema carpocapsae TaxID=34508 RepID=A0A4U5NWF6_STECR|nr:hypothetical protein L596_011955 [Steinernema carpocapsae]
MANKMMMAVAATAERRRERREGPIYIPRIYTRSDSPVPVIRRRRDAKRVRAKDGDLQHLETNKDYVDVAYVDADSYRGEWGRNA